MNSNEVTSSEVIKPGDEITYKVGNRTYYGTVRTASQYGRRAYVEDDPSDWYIECTNGAYIKEQYDKVLFIRVIE